MGFFYNTIYYVTGGPNLARRRPKRPRISAGRQRTLLENITRDTRITSSIDLSGAELEEVKLTLPHIELYSKTPTTPASIDEGGRLYVRPDGKLYFLSSEVAELDLTSTGSLSASFPGIDDQSSSNDDQITITDTAIIFNEDSDDVDFRVESDANTHMFFVDAGNNRVEVKGASPGLRIDANTDNHAKLEWAENGTRKWVIYHDHTDDNLTFKQGTAVSGSDLMVITQDGGVGIGTITPNPGLTVVNDYQSTTFESILSDGQHSGDVLRYSPGANDTLTSGQIYFLHTDGTWDSTDADAVATGASQLLGVGLGGSSQTVGVLTRGFIRIPSTEILNLPGSGSFAGLPLYVSTTAGHFDFTAPSGSGDFVRIVGYALDDDSSDVLAYFNPDQTWVEIA